MIDLHTHSTVSDGTDPRNASRNWRTRPAAGPVALTDHDCQDGIAPATARAVQLGVDLVPGAKISC